LLRANVAIDAPLSHGDLPKEKRAKMRKGQLFLRDFTVKLFAGVEFWIERLPALLGSARRLRQTDARGLFALLI
jgi:hypothetical protein